MLGFRRGVAAYSCQVLPGGGDWYAEVAPVEYQALYAAGAGMPSRSGRYAGAHHPPPELRGRLERVVAARLRSCRVSKRWR